MEELNISILDSEDFKYLPGQGVEGIVENKSINLVGPNYLKEQNFNISERNNDDFSGTMVYIIIDDEVSGYFMFSDQIREESFETIKVLKEAGIKNLFFTGDKEKVAKKGKR